MTLNAKLCQLLRCGSGHVWQQYDLSSLGDDEVVKLPTDNTSLPIMDMGNMSILLVSPMLS